MIITSYFANYRKFPIELTRVSIARILPNKLQMQESAILAPPPNLLYDWKNGKITEVEYIQRYYAHLKNNKEFVKKEIKRLDNQNSLLLCYEKRGEFCHRHLLRNYIEIELKDLNIETEEL